MPLQPMSADMMESACMMNQYMWNNLMMQMIMMGKMAHPFPYDYRQIEPSPQLFQYTPYYPHKPALIENMINPVFNNM
jgi:hypothetical protein